jgi:hypothetical protein
VGLSVGLGTRSRAETAGNCNDPDGFLSVGTRRKLCDGSGTGGSEGYGVMGVPVKGGGRGAGAVTGEGPLVAGDAAASGESFNNELMILYELVFSFAWGSGTKPNFTAVR